MITTIALAAVLAFPPIPPVVELPSELEVCIVTAELCIARAELNGCSEPTWDERGHCVGEYEDCSYFIDEAHEDSCRITHVWCVLENDHSSKDFIEYCEEVAAVCGTET